MKLGDVIKISKGKYITKKDSKEGPYPVILGGREPAYYIDKYNHDGKAIVVSRSGASAGFVSFWDEPIFVTDGFLVEPAGDIDFDFLYYLMKYKQKDFLGLQGGSAIPHVTPKIINSVNVDIPDGKSQKAIAGVLMPFDKLIKNNQKQIKLLEETAQRLYKEWFVDLRFPGYEGVEIIGGVPDGWKKEYVGNLIDKPIRTKQVKASEYLKDGQIAVIDQGREFIAGYTNDIEAVVNIGAPIIVFGDHTRVLKYIQFPFAKGADGTQLIVNSDECMPQPLLYCSLVNIDLSNYHYARHFKYLKAEETIVPSKKIAEEFEKKVAPMFKQIQNLRNIILGASKLRDNLLPKLMNGEIEV